MDYRIMTIGEQLMLLERCEEDTGWQVILTTFVDLLSRYDEWIPCKSPHQARVYIADYSEGLAQEFIQRAEEWWINEQARTGGNA